MRRKAPVHIIDWKINVYSYRVSGVKVTTCMSSVISARETYRKPHLVVSR